MDIKNLKIKAENGHPESQFQLALKYCFGIGVMKSEQTALFWFKKAAMQGHAGAQFQIACSLLDKKKTHKEGMEWLKKGAMQGHTDSQKLLATKLFIKGDSEEGLKWLRKAANHGDEEAQRLLNIHGGNNKNNEEVESPCGDEIECEDTDIVDSEGYEKQITETEEENEETMKEETMTTEEILKDNKKYAGYDNPLFGYDWSSYITCEKADENGMCNFYSTTYIGGNKKVDLKNPSVSLPYTEALEISKYDYPAQEFSKRRSDEVWKIVYAAINAMSDDED